MRKGMLFKRNIKQEWKEATMLYRGLIVAMGIVILVLLILYFQ